MWASPRDTHRIVVDHKALLSTSPMESFTLSAEYVQHLMKAHMLTHTKNPEHGMFESRILNGS